jgi:hypothetical protein
MGLLGSLFTRRPAPRRDPPVTADDVTAVYIALRNRICDFKDVTNMSWALILAAIQRMSIRLFIQARGCESTLKLLECMISKMEEEQGVRPHVVRNVTLYPDLSPEQLRQLAKLNSLLRHVANETIANGHPVEYVAQAFSGFVALVGSRISDQLEEFFVSGLVHASYREIQSGAFNDVGTSLPRERQ